ncbi:Nucleotide-binding universal stress protein, UspA family [Hymenobacter daecheongensis DSM 21074]|uniref:Nucleotide-binding universal stress protein, UspA family n=1 Tax=Hymenobacter daecheongensis DSM 21074 TaxID=1121955 RepID=A0A1M6IUU6_9BACT|nr:universal stress protein [Hymenobacter daecheongensis]SHJ38221.1 Nucleotide-binding universal stress protein, UspA family [Hymenobacter daecheongensis DSM 21074]
MTLTTVLCPLDFSLASAEQVSYAAALAVASGAELRLLHVQESQPALAAPVLPAGTQLAAYRAGAEQAGARVTTVVRPGQAAAEIVAEARACRANLIVIGAHGQTGLTRFLMGSTAEAVVRTAPCATLLVKPSPAPADEYRVSA